jgi:hypothetical protein
LPDRRDGIAHKDQPRRLCVRNHDAEPPLEIHDNGHVQQGVGAEVFHDRGWIHHLSKGTPIDAAITRRMSASRSRCVVPSGSM